MADGSKTEKATPKKRKDERKKGNVFQSSDIIAAVSLLGVFFCLRILFPGMYTNVNSFLEKYMGFAVTETEPTAGFISDMTWDIVISFTKIVLPILLISVLLTIIATGVQTKFLFSGDSLKPKFSRMNPISGIKKLFSIKSLVDVIKGIIKISIIFYFLYQFLLDEFLEFSKTLTMGVYSSTLFLLDAIVQLVIRIGAAFLVIAAFDFFYQWWDYEKQIRMSKQDLKEEYKQMEGDPQIKAKIKETQRRMSMSRMMQAVPEADVVIRNPTHFAVALKYDIDKDIAPVVVAKGQDDVALRIVKVAEDSKVCVIENKTLTRAIYASTEINGIIPMEYYGAIAELLVYVYKLNNKDL